MRKVTYVLADGNIVNTWTDAVKAGQPYSVQMVDVPEPRPARTEKQEEMVQRFGYISSKLANL